jgi:hypothetical protein
MGFFLCFGEGGEGLFSWCVFRVSFLCVWGELSACFICMTLLFSIMLGINFVAHNI